MIVRHKLFSTMVERWHKDQLVKTIGHTPLELSPRKNHNVLGRCYPHKERAIWKYRMSPLLGSDMRNREGELTPLSGYANTTSHRPQPTRENALCIIDKTRTSCVQTNYEVSNLCRGCVSRACSSNCLKSYISFQKDGQAQIDHDICINCGQCRENYPYHTIVYIPVPYGESCPVGAISKNEDGIEYIDESKYIHCGSYLNACPFGAIFEISQVFDVLGAMERGEQVVAVVAPATLDQFKATCKQIYEAVKKIGFHDAIEVAQGAINTVSHEDRELVEKVGAGQAFVTTSCCPSFYGLVNKHAPGLKPFVPSSHSPMVYTAERARKLYPDSKIIFFGPYVAKRKEIKRPNIDVDMVVTLEELSSILEGLDIDTNTVERYKSAVESVREAHAFAYNGDVKDAVISYLSNTEEYKDFVERLTAGGIAGMDKKVVAKFRAYGRHGKTGTQFAEMMTCLGRCMIGPSTFNDVLAGRHQLLREVEKIDLTYASCKEQE